MSITLIIGPMFSGKTTELIRLVDRKNIAGKKCIVIKHSIDTRYDSDSERHITTHNQYSYKSVDVISVSSITEDLVRELIHTKNVVAIEEGQFFPELCQWCNIMANNGIDVIVSALDGDYKQEMFGEGEIGKLIPHSEVVIKLSAICMRCRNADAHYTIRTIDGNEQILVGGNDIYQSVCRKCLIKFKNAS